MTHDLRMSKTSDTHPISASGFLATLYKITRLESNEVFRCLKNICQEPPGTSTMLLLRRITSHVMFWSSRLSLEQ
jgi:hypothetical protein